MHSRRIVSGIAIAAIVFGALTIRALFWIAVTIVAMRAMKSTPNGRLMT